MNDVLLCKPVPEAVGREHAGRRRQVAIRQGEKIGDGQNVDRGQFAVVEVRQQSRRLTCLESDKSGPVPATASGTHLDGDRRGRYFQGCLI